MGLRERLVAQPVTLERKKQAGHLWVGFSSGTLSLC